MDYSGECFVANKNSHFKKRKRMEGQHTVGDWIANIVLMSIGIFNRLVFGKDKLTKKQLVAFYLFCVGVVWIVDKIPVSDTIRSGIMLCSGLIMLNLVKAIIKGGNKGEDKVAKNIEDSIDKYTK